MNASRFLYRSRQFWQAISTRSSPQDMELLTSILSPAQVELFQQMQKSEQAHSLVVLDELMNKGEEDPDLLTAALLHDAGKTRAPIRLWERVMIVIVRAICQNCIQKWGAIDIDDPETALGWRRAFIVAEQHPAWGADLAAECGTSPMAVSLIARHQEPLSPGVSSMEDILLKKLQAVDDKN
jgi:hypothetical protein